MANTNLFDLLPRHIAADYLKLKSITSKLQRTACSIAFIKKSLHHNLVPTFGNCSCGENYVGESVRSVVLRWAEHEVPNKQSETAKH